MKYILSEYEPKLPPKYFEELSAIPRGSCNEKAAADWIENVAKDLGLGPAHIRRGLSIPLCEQSESDTINPGGQSWVNAKTV